MGKFKVDMYKIPFVEGNEGVVEDYLNKKYEEGWEFVYRIPADFMVFKWVGI